jgi:hypothetical protein
MTNIDITEMVDLDKFKEYNIDIPKLIKHAIDQASNQISCDLGVHWEDLKEQTALNAMVRLGQQLKLSADHEDVDWLVYGVVDLLGHLWEKHGKNLEALVSDPEVDPDSIYELIDTWYKTNLCY